MFLAGNIVNIYLLYLKYGKERIRMIDFLKFFIGFTFLKVLFSSFSFLNSGAVKCDCDIVIAINDTCIPSRVLSDTGS